MSYDIRFRDLPQDPTSIARREVTRNLLRFVV